MLGIADLSIVAAYVLAILSGVICLAYGLLNWNSYE